jgi:hypothetical protein
MVAQNHPDLWIPRHSLRGKPILVLRINNSSTMIENKLNQVPIPPSDSQMQRPLPITISHLQIHAMSQEYPNHIDLFQLNSPMKKQPLINVAIDTSHKFRVMTQKHLDSPVMILFHRVYKRRFPIVQLLIDL